MFFFFWFVCLVLFCFVLFFFFLGGGGGGITIIVHNYNVTGGKFQCLCQRAKKLIHGGKLLSQNNKFS